MRFLLIAALVSGCAGSHKAASDPDDRGNPGPARPSSVGPEVIQGIFDGSVPVSAYLDAKDGVVYLDHFEPPGDDETPWAPTEVLLCGSDAVSYLGQIQQELADPTRREDLEETADCSGDVCTFGRTMEWDPAIHLHFVPGGHGLTLEAITIDDEVLGNDEAIAAEHAAQAQLIERIGQTACSQ